MRYGHKWPTYAADWDRMVIRPNRVAEFERDARHILGSKDRYLAVELATGVPWYLIGCLHLREADLNFHTYLGNGDPLNHKTRHKPRGRGPFATWRDGAIDALKYDGLTSVKDWRLEKILYYAEIYNGTGYNNRGLPSPYLWGGTNIQKAGKYLADGEWNGQAWDGQPGCAPMLFTMMKMDNTIRPIREE